MNSMDYGLCPESGTAMVFYVLHGMVVYSDYTFLNQLALTGLRILDSRLVELFYIVIIFLYQFSTSF